MKPCSVELAVLVALASGCGGLAQSVTQDAGREATRGTRDASGADASTQDVSAPDSMSLQDGTTDGPPEAAMDGSADAIEWDGACLRDGGGKPGQCCASQSDCSPNPAIDQICCNSHACVVCISKR